MLEPLQDLPEGVIGFTAVGKLEADDYRTVLIPAIESEVKAGHDLRVVLYFPTFDGLTPGATWEDFKFGIENLTKWKKIALVTDIDWMRHLTNMFGWMTPGEMKTFAVAEKDIAIAWAAA